MESASSAFKKDFGDQEYFDDSCYDRRELKEKKDEIEEKEREFERRKREVEERKWEFEDMKLKLEEEKRRTLLGPMQELEESLRKKMEEKMMDFLKNKINKLLVQVQDKHSSVFP